MKRFTKTASVVAIAVALLPVSTLADSLERPWKDPEAAKEQRPAGFFNSLFSKKPSTAEPAAPVKSAAPTEPVAPVKPVSPNESVKSVVGNINIITKQTGKVIHNVQTSKKQPLPVKTGRKKQPLPVKTVRKKQPLPVKTARKKANKEGLWWESVGNPAVFTFRDCSVGYSRRQMANGNTSSPAQIITQAMKSSCQTEFAKMAGVLIGGLGEERSNAILTELAKTTFLPAVTTAMAVEKNTRTAKVAKITDEEKLQAAKAEMFRCFSERTDRLTIAKNIQANTIADAVLAGCRNESDVFFDRLFADSKASTQVRQQQKNIALNETYKIAIIRRVMVNRKPPQVKTAIQQ